MKTCKLTTIFGLVQASDEEFFLLMKVGPCRKQFAAWQACEVVAKATGNENLRKKCEMDRCEQKVELLRQCVQANIDYHIALLQFKDGADKQAAIEASHDKNPLSTAEVPIDENPQSSNDEDREEHFQSTAPAGIDENTLSTTSKACRDNDPLRPSSIWFVAPVVILSVAYGLSKGWF